MSGLSSRPEARARQLANLKRGDNSAPAGNQRRKTHGAYAQVAVVELDAKTAEIFGALAEDAPQREADGGLPAADAATVRLAAEALCRADSVRGYLARRGIENEKGELRTTEIDLERRLRAEAADHLEALGMSPRARARLGLDLARTFAVVDASAALSEPDDDARAAGMRELGLSVIDGEEA